MAEEVKNPEFTLGAHCFLKGLQMGSAIGVMSTPILLLPRFKESKYRSLTGIGKLCARLGVLFGLGSLGAMYYKLEFATDPDQKKAGYEDRAFRLQHNEGQKWVDQVTAGTALGGMVLNSLVFSGGFTGAVRGGAIGMGLGVIAIPFVNTFLETQKKMKLSEQAIETNHDEKKDLRNEKKDK
eukprot:TRINITY_DN2734_c0_g1_i1.p1 TRINITY_DN2734_c0_g1~~TRINITY_DN2734_c0_g1_i1.p1  ORF type:complete len:193 (+),score=57.89 TRINITY_DN2734_c0_g1_i1:34-579(+)